MRFLPDQYRGIHPAFPAWPEESVAFHAGLASFPKCGLWAIPVGTLCFVLRRPNPWGTATKAAAYFGVAATAWNTAGFYLQDRHARTFLRAQGIEVPERKFVERLGRFDLDDAILSGGILGILFTVRKNPTSVSGWKRYLGAFSIGSSFSMIAFAVHTGLRKDSDQIMNAISREQELKREAAKWRPIVTQALRKAAGLVQPSTEPLGPGDGKLNVLKSPLRGDSSGSASDSQGGTMGTVNISGPPQGGQVGKDDPHITIQLPDDAEPTPKPQTNYEWKSDREIEDLEKHIGELVQRRQRLARESEFLWSWLAEKEAEFYNTPDGPAKKAMMRYLDVLAGAQRSTWAEVSMTDWMIADCKKMIEQRRSAASNNESKVTWRAPCSQAAAHTAPLHALKGARNLLQGIDQLNTQFLQMQTQMAIEMADPDFELKENNQVYHPVKQKMVSEKEAFLDSKKAIQEQIDEIASVQKAIKDMLADGEAKMKQIPQDATSPKRS